MVRTLALRSILLLVSLVWMLQGTRTLPVALASKALPASGLASAASQSCQAYWYVSFYGITSFSLLNIDPDNTPIEGLRFDHGYSDPYASGGGFLDFDGDRKTDIFSVRQRPDGFYQWRYSSGGVSPWNENMAYDSRPLTDLRFGRFNQNNLSDVFAWRTRPDGAIQWMYSPEGYYAWTDLANADDDPWLLGFGDYNADNLTDVFAARPVGSGYYHWRYSSAGIGAYQPFLSDPATVVPYSPYDIRFGDSIGYFNAGNPNQADGYTDVLFVTSANWSGVPAFAWTSYNYQVNTAQGQEPDLSRVLLGDFDADNSTDIFYIKPLNNGYFQWYFLPFGRENPRALTSATTPFSDLRLGDFNGDGFTDVFTLVHDCRTFVPLALSP